MSTGRRSVARRVIFLEALGFGGVIVLVWLNEVTDIPARLLGAPPTPPNWHEAALETLIVAALAVGVCRQTARLFARMRQLEGILPICAACKKVRDERGEWHTVETYVRARSEADFSHGICPDCARDLYPDARLDGRRPR